MRDIRRCDNCQKEVRDIEAIGWWEAKRIYPVLVDQTSDEYDFCSYTCLDDWVAKRRVKK